MTRNGRADTRGQIYDAAEKLLAEVPLHELSVAQIIEPAGVSRATFYFYCSSKFAVVEGLLTQIMDEIDPAFGGEENAVDALYAIWHGAIYCGAEIPYDSQANAAV